MTQRDLLKRLLREAGGIGCFSGDLRRAGIGNPSQRITELRDEGWDIIEKAERYPSGRGIGTRWTRVSEPAARMSAPRESRRSPGICESKAKGSVGRPNYACVPAAAPEGQALAALKLDSTGHTRAPASASLNVQSDQELSTLASSPSTAQDPPALLQHPNPSLLWGAPGQASTSQIAIDDDWDFEDAA